MKPEFLTFKKNHYTNEPGKDGYMSSEDVYGEIGIDFDRLVKENISYKNTCATRVSLTLLKCNVPFTGRLSIKAGKFKGKKIEPGAKRLADQLALRRAFGRPLVLDAKQAPARLLGKKGAVFFDRVTGYGGGHIDVLEHDAVGPLCNSHCYFDCKQVWFWALD